MQHRRNDPRRAVGRRGHHAAAAGVLLVHRQGVEVDPVEHAEGIAQAGLRPLAQLAVERRRTAPDLQPAGHDALVAAAGLDAVLHHLPDTQQAGAGFLGGAPGLLVLGHQLADRQAFADAMVEQLPRGLEGERQRRAVLDDAVEAGGLVVDHETAAHRVVLAAADLQAGGVEGTEDHAIGMVGQRLADQRKVFLLDEADRPLAEQAQLAAGTDGIEPSGNRGGIHRVRLLALQAEQYRLVAAVALAGGAERAVQLDLDAGSGLQQPLAPQPLGKARGGTHRPHGVGAGRPDADLEQIEDTQGHARLRLRIGRHHGGAPVQSA
ncbi:hypothetical protein PAERUG_E16_London_17_VIM_2_04_14_00120 [Pseudomonas aeruginosa]|nr:hypothetical protein PAERUG_E16_London_17_VIM_2_04_14_00120 [Pseudomonas aeruginosa]